MAIKTAEQGMFDLRRYAPTSGDWQWKAEEGRRDAILVKGGMEAVLRQSEMSGKRKQMGGGSGLEAVNKTGCSASLLPTGSKSKSLSSCPRIGVLNTLEGEYGESLNMLWQQSGGGGGGGGGRTHVSLTGPSPLLHWPQQSVGPSPTAPRTSASVSTAFTACPPRMSSQVTNSLYIVQPRALSTRRFHPYTPQLAPKPTKSNKGEPLNSVLPSVRHRRRQLLSSGSSGEKLVGYFHPESSPAEEYLWNANFFGHSSVSQLTYTLVYLLGKILCIRSGAELRRMHIWNTLKLFPLRRLQQPNQKVAMEYEMHYTLPSDPVTPPPVIYENSKRLLSLSERAKCNRFVVTLDHILVKTQRGFVIKHSAKNNHQKCLVCLHVLLLQKRSCLNRSLTMGNYFLSWMDSSPGAKFLTEPLSEVALDTIVHDIRVVLTGLQQRLHRGPFPVEPNLWSLFAHWQQFKSSSSHEDKRTLFDRVEEWNAPLDLSVRGRAHPKCLDFWPEVTKRARQGIWQCADCKSCSVCKNKETEGVILICDACDKGFHGSCHTPIVSEKSTDHTMPWICSACQAEGYRVQPGPVPTPLPVSTPSSADSGVASVEAPASEAGVNASSANSLPEPSPTAMMTPVGHAAPAPSEVISTKVPEAGISSDSISTTVAPTTATTNPSSVELHTTEGELNEEENDSMPPNLGTPHHDSSASGTPLLQTSNCRPEDVRLWTVDHVAEWLRDQGGFDKEAETFRQQDIDGASLLLLKSMSLLTSVGIKMGPAIKICDRIKQLQAQQARVELKIVK